MNNTLLSKGSAVCPSDVLPTAQHLIEDFQRRHPNADDSKLDGVRALMHSFDRVNKNNLRVKLAALGELAVLVHCASQDIEGQDELLQNFERLKQSMQSEFARLSSQWPQRRPQLALETCRPLMTNFCGRKLPQNTDELRQAIQHYHDVFRAIETVAAGFERWRVLD